MCTCATSTNWASKSWFEANKPPRPGADHGAHARSRPPGLLEGRRGQTVAELKERWRDLAQRFDVRTDNAPFQAYGRGQAPAAHNPGGARRTPTGYAP